MEGENTGLKSAFLQLLGVHEVRVSHIYQMYQFVTTPCGMCGMWCVAFIIEDDLNLGLILSSCHF
jgi:hypothetical protein